MAEGLNTRKFSVEEAVFWTGHFNEELKRLRKGPNNRKILVDYTIQKILKYASHAVKTLKTSEELK